MLPLVTDFEDSVFRYTQVERVGDSAIFQQTHKLGQMQRYEVVKIHMQAAPTWPHGVTTPEKEASPPASKWGAEGWTVFTLEEAQVLAQQLQVPAPPLSPPLATSAPCAREALALGTPSSRRRTPARSPGCTRLGGR